MSWPKRTRKQLREEAALAFQARMFEGRIMWFEQLPLWMQLPFAARLYRELIDPELWLMTLQSNNVNEFGEPLWMK